MISSTHERRLNPKEECEGFLFHNQFWIEPAVLIKNGIDVYTV